jgi:multiple antibiotic resistance protein
LSFFTGILQDFTQSLITIFVILDPIGAIPFFQGLTAGATSRQRGMIARKTVIVTIVVLLIFAYLGDAILGALHITLDSVMIAGGVFILVFAVKDVASSQSPSANTSATKKRESALPKEVADSIAAFPLAIPLLAGPGAIATVMVLNNPDYGAATGLRDFSTALAIVVDCLIVLLLFGLSSRLMRILKPSVMVITGKVMDILMGAIGVSFIIRGAVGIFGITLP